MNSYHWLLADENYNPVASGLYFAHPHLKKNTWWSYMNLSNFYEGNGEERHIFSIHKISLARSWKSITQRKNEYYAYLCLDIAKK